MSVCVVGGGSWATSLVKLLLRNQVKVYWWVRKQEKVDYILQNGHNPNYLSGVDLALKPEEMGTSLPDLLQKTDTVLLAVPSFFVKEVLEQTQPLDWQGKKIITAVKGLIKGDNLLPTDYFRQILGVPRENLMMLTGPSHAEEVAFKRLTYLTIGSYETTNFELADCLFNTSFIRLKYSNDVEGLEFSAILKNIYAIAAGICHRLGYGDNFQAVLVSNAIKEIELFLQHICPLDNRPILDNGYLGDLLVTAYSQFSRNRSFGHMIGEGYETKIALMEMRMVPEGYYSIAPMYDLKAQKGVKMPILDAVHQCIHGDRLKRAEVIKNMTENIY